MPTPATPHASHDELLVVRLFDDDVNEAERARAIELVANCDECSVLLADLRDVAEATVALPVPPRPRDFFLSDADASRLNARKGRWRLFDLGLRRSFGGAFVSLGLAGLLLTGAVSALLPGSGSGSVLDRNALAPMAVGSPNAFGAAAASSADSEKNAGSIAGGTPIDQTQGGAQLPFSSPANLGPATAAPTAAPAAATPAAATPAELAVSGSPAPTTESGGLAPGAGSGQPAESTVAASIDWQPFALAGSAGMLLVGLVVLLIPTRLRRRARR